MNFLLLPGLYSVLRFPPGAELGAAQGAALGGGAWAGDFFCQVSTAEELSVVCGAELAEGIRGRGALGEEAGWRILKIRGPLDFGLVGVLAEASRLLAAAGIPIFVVSTFDTDYILVKEDRLEGALEALRSGGHRVETLVPESPRRPGVAGTGL